MEGAVIEAARMRSLRSDTRELSRALLFTCASALCGCSLILKPPPIEPPIDAGVDAADGMIDAPDANPCVPTQQQETNCTNGMDDDCGGGTDCEDFDCRGVPECCRTGNATSLCLRDDFVRVPVETMSEIVFSSATCTAGVEEFGTAGRTRALISNECQPINFGMRFEADFRITATCGALCDYAGFALTPLQTLTDGSPLPSDLRVLVRSDGSARVERAGRVLSSFPASTFVVDLAVAIHMTMTLEPGPDPSGQDVLFATVALTQGTTRGDTILPRQAVMPLSDLRCEGTSEIGLFAALEGAGTDVEIVGPLVAREHECSNPSQFRLPVDPIDLGTVTSCAAGGIGKPALVNYCYAGCDSAAEVQWDLWVDASETQRADEIFRTIDYGVCAYANNQSLEFPSGSGSGAWLARAATPPWLVQPPGAREPTLLPIEDQSAATTRVPELWLAFAEPTEEPDVYRIVGGRIGRDRSENAFTRRVLLDPTLQATGCRSVRDPLLVAHHIANADDTFAVDGAWLLFTCERENADPRTIGVVRLASDFAQVDGSLQTSLFVPTLDTIATYAERGAYAPEGFMEARGMLRTLRLWFFARDGQGNVRLAYAEGRAQLGEDVFPAVEVYPANPILEASSAILGGPCGTGCALTGASVTPSFNSLTDFFFLFSRARPTPTGVVHELVPLLQPRPLN